MVDRNRLLAPNEARTRVSCLLSHGHVTLPFMSWLRPLLAPQHEARLRAVEAHIAALHDEAAEARREARELTSQLQQLRQDELRRQAEHTGVVDQLNRLYRRMAARVAREAELNGKALTHPSDSEESVAAMKRRLGR